jgi:hypothetical protein
MITKGVFLHDYCTGASLGDGELIMAGSAIRWESLPVAGRSSAALAPQQGSDWRE